MRGSIGLPWGTGSLFPPELEVPQWGGALPLRGSTMSGARGVWGHRQRKIRSPHLTSSTGWGGLPGSCPVRATCGAGRKPCNQLLPSPICTRGRKSVSLPTYGHLLLKNLRNGLL